MGILEILIDPDVYDVARIAYYVSIVVLCTRLPEIVGEARIFRSNIIKTQDDLERAVSFLAYRPKTRAELRAERELGRKLRLSNEQHH